MQYITTLELRRNIKKFAWHIHVYIINATDAALMSWCCKVIAILTFCQQSVPGKITGHCGQICERVEKEWKMKIEKESDRIRGYEIKNGKVWRQK